MKIPALPQENIFWIKKQISGRKKFRTVQSRLKIFVKISLHTKVFEIWAKMRVGSHCLYKLSQNMVITSYYMCSSYARHEMKTGKSCVYVYLKCSYSQNMRIIFMKGIGTQLSQQCWGTAGGPSLLEEGRQSHLRGFHMWWQCHKIRCHMWHLLWQCHKTSCHMWHLLWQCHKMSNVTFLWWQCHRVRCHKSLIYTGYFTFWGVACKMKLRGYRM